LRWRRPARSTLPLACVCRSLGCMWPWNRSKLADLPEQPLKRCPGNAPAPCLGNGVAWLALQPWPLSCWGIALESLWPVCRRCGGASAAHVLGRGLIYSFGVALESTCGTTWQVWPSVGYLPATSVGGLAGQPGRRYTLLPCHLTAHQTHRTTGADVHASRRSSGEPSRSPSASRPSSLKPSEPRPGTLARRSQTLSFGLYSANGRDSAPPLAVRVVSRRSQERCLHPVNPPHCHQPP